MHGLSHLAKAQEANFLFLNYYNPFNNSLSVLKKIKEPSETLGSLRWNKQARLEILTQLQKWFSPTAFSPMVLFKPLVIVYHNQFVSWTGGEN